MSHFGRANYNIGNYLSPLARGSTESIHTACCKELVLSRRVSSLECHLRVRTIYLKFSEGYMHSVSHLTPDGWMDESGL